ncbi:hypothetical protein, partial [Brachybacterium sp. HMSC06H03]|uniref:hypothetical protein n=1 Tax=Brachybacterium sp. HMSC06H03 TaxID=1581127 RepID=UPI001AEF8010
MKVLGRFSESWPAPPRPSDESDAAPATLASAAGPEHPTEHSPHARIRTAADRRDRFPAGKETAVSDQQPLQIASIV